MRFIQIAVFLAACGPNRSQTQTGAGNDMAAESHIVNQDTKPEGDLQEKLSGYVLLRDGTPLYASYDSNRPAIKEPQVRSNAPDDVAVFKVLSTRKDWVEVENIPSLSEIEEQKNVTFCHWNSEPELENIRLHFWVKREDLQPVLNRPFVQEFADGTKIELKPGNPLSPKATEAHPNLRWTQSGQLDFTISILREFVGLSYRPLTGFSYPDDEQVSYSIRSKRVENGSLRFGESGTIRFRKHSPDLYQIENRGDEMLVQVVSECSKITALVAVSDIEIDKSVGHGYGSGSGRHKGKFIKKNAPVYWLDGSMAGIVVDVLKVDEGSTDGNRRCVSYPVRRSLSEDEYTVTDELDLCFDESDVMPQRPAK